MAGTTHTPNQPAAKSWLDRALSPFADVRAGEGITAMLMLINIFVLLVCYSVIKTVREPLILLGGGAEVRSYAAAGQALLLMGFVPAYGWIASRVNRAKLLVTVTLFFIACIEVFAMAVAARVPYVGVAFFIWVGIFNMSLVAQFWSFANDIYTKNAGERLFPVIVIGMTAGAPLGSFVAGRLFRMGLTPQVILQISALLLAMSVALYLRINRRESGHAAASQERLSAKGGFRLVLGSGYLRLVALLVVLLNIVNTTGEYMVAKLLTSHVAELAAADPTFNRQAFIGAFSGDYQFWVNVTAFLLQAFVASRLVKYQGLRGALLALPLIALGGYSIIAAGVGFSVVRWIKTAENATDYSIMNTARQLLWLPTSREEKYKAKQAIDTFFVRIGDLISAAVVFVGTSVLQLTVNQFAIGNIVLTLVWLGVALLILNPRHERPQVSSTPSVDPTVRRAAAAAALLLAVASQAGAQDLRADRLAEQRADKATKLHPYQRSTLERRLALVDRALTTERPLYPFIGSVFEGGGFALGPGYRTRFGDTGMFNAHAALSIRRYKLAEASVKLPDFAQGRLSVQMHGNYTDAPAVAFFGIGGDSQKGDRTTYGYRTTTVGASARFQAFKNIAFGASLDAIDVQAGLAGQTVEPLAPTYRRSQFFAEFDSRTSPDFTRRGSFFRVDWADYRQTNSGTGSFQRVDAELQQFIPVLRENWVIALRALASTTDAASGHEVPYFMLPSLGGNKLLRGYSSFRFRDNNRLLFTGEYRWTAGPLVDMALFVDAGKVAARRADLNLSNLETSYGIGMTLHSFSTTITRIELARSREGMGLIFSFSPSF